MKGREWLGLAVLGGVGYWVYQALTKASGAAGKAADAVTSGIANTYVGLTNWLYGSSTTTPTGNVILPNGNKVALSQLAVTWDDTNNVATFTYQGANYVIPPNPSGGPAYDQNGDYHAQ